MSITTSIRGSPMSGLRNRRSITKPRAKLAHSVSRKAGTTGTPADTTSARKMKPPRARTSPWAKLRTLDDLKIITKPMADIP